MVVHVFQVHKETISKIPNAKPGRDSVKNDIFGMEGIPGEEIGEDGEPVLKKLKLDIPEIAVPPYNPYSSFGNFNNTMPPYTMPFPVQSPNNWYPGTSAHTVPISNPIPNQVIPSYTQFNPTPVISPQSKRSLPPPVVAPPISTNDRLPQVSQYPVRSGISSEKGGMSPLPSSLPSSPPHSDGQKLQVIILVYDNPDVSTEERRANLDRYKYLHKNPNHDGHKSVYNESIHNQQISTDYIKSEEQ